MQIACSASRRVAAPAPPSHNPAPAASRPQQQAWSGLQANSSDINASSRRQLLSAAATAVAAALIQPLPAAAADVALTPQAAAAARAAPNPYQRGLALEYGLQADGRIRSCETDANPNCVGTAGGANEAYMQPWEAPQGRPADAMADFEAALLAVEPQAVLVDSASLPTGGEYRRWAVPDKLFDHDNIEVVINFQQAPYEAEPPLVTFRSQAARVKYIWPIQQAVTDFGAQRARLRAVRARLGWRILVCDVLECYQE